ncbi:hypothetical protein SKAU_G00423400 [Synaphobranchus kaupii]|uniref:Uncharacterized protein n=1 Tax=Synaphobranchus kaupii TaxID=118154 RepID=A0A9Q1IAI0_SYNKA|nr:hypothetical protein SKAU_G00423400 [Synaphobranchus kaupii]
MLQTHYANLRSTVTFHSIFGDAQRTGITDLVQAPALPPRRRAPRRYDDGEAAHQWEDPEEYYRSQFFEVIDLLTRRFDQPTLHLLKNIKNVVLTAVNSLPGCTQAMLTWNGPPSCRSFRQFYESTTVPLKHPLVGRRRVSERRLNNLLFLHKELTDDLNLRKVLRSFCFSNARRLAYFGKV